ncbi:hypothetical protein P7K49_032006 [Saguinus oedipus]|uniref:Uncharacterized protein n=1 Tax=Saguinus oedipus TaxID=9490 RepID=A0ABQ9TXY0_SAGOE|nr:hypothetical protein P7K49_032006 [Saguinus oedipus]
MAPAWYCKLSARPGQTFGLAAVQFDLMGDGATCPAERGRGESREIDHKAWQAPSPTKLKLKPAHRRAWQGIHQLDLKQEDRAQGRRDAIWKEGLISPANKPQGKTTQQPD